MPNSPSARSNAARPTNPARMRLLLAHEKPCDCGKPALVRQPKGDGTGGYESFCLECLSGTTTDDYFADLHADLKAMGLDD